MSSPRAATLVASSVCTCPRRKAVSTSSRARWLLLPCNVPTVNPSLLSCFPNFSTPYFVLPKMRLLSPSVEFKRVQSAAIFCSCGTWYAICSMVLCSPPARVMSTLTGFLRNFCCKLATQSGMVAEKRAVCRVSGVLSNISSMAGANPLSSIWSASSSTHTRSWLSTKVPRSRWSFTRPGVPTTICDP